MSWKSVFDAGPCTVKLYATGDTSNPPDWSGTLGKGESSPVYTNPHSLQTSQVVIGVDGSVALDSNSIPAAVVVAPNYDVSVLQTRIIAIAAEVGVQFANATNDGAPKPQLFGNIAIDQATGACTPDAITFSPAAGAALGLYGASS